MNSHRSWAPADIMRIPAAQARRVPRMRSNPFCSACPPGNAALQLPTIQPTRNKPVNFQSNSRPGQMQNLLASLNLVALSINYQHLITSYLSTIHQLFLLHKYRLFYILCDNLIKINLRTLYHVYNCLQITYLDVV
jgi:hypothetical protein